MQHYRIIVRALIFSILLTSLAACQRATPQPTLDLAQTAAVLATRDFSTRQALDTVAAKLNFQPSFTPSLTATTRPTRTATATPSFTPSKLPTRTGTPLPTATATRTPSPWECRLISQDPKDGVTMKPGANFTTHWVIQNLGAATWSAKYMDFIQTGGDKIALVTTYDLPKDVKTLEKIELEVFMVAPDVTGAFSVDWKLVNTDTGKMFCPVNLHLWVSDK
jgi:hypothetical protein